MSIKSCNDNSLASLLKNSRNNEKNLFNAEVHSHSLLNRVNKKQFSYQKNPSRTKLEAILEKPRNPNYDKQKLSTGRITSMQKSGMMKR